MVIVALLFATAPFWHKLFPKESTQEFLGFSNSRRFLYSIGTHLSGLGNSFFLMWIGLFITQTYKKLILSVSVFYMGISLYFLLWSVAPIKDYERWVYEVGIIVSSIFSVFLVYTFMHTKQNLVVIIRELFSFIYTETDEKGYIKEELKRDYDTRRIELIDKAVGNDK